MAEGDDLDKIERALRVVRTIKARMQVNYLITIQGETERAPFKVASLVARAAKWNTNNIEQAGESTTILINCDLAESENLHFEIRKTWKPKPDAEPDSRIVSEATLSVWRPQQKTLPLPPQQCFDIADEYGVARARRDLMDNLFRSALGAISE